MYGKSLGEWQTLPSVANLTKHGSRAQHGSPEPSMAKLYNRALEINPMWVHLPAAHPSLGILRL